MTVTELIEKLKRYDGDATVEVFVLDSTFKNFSVYEDDEGNVTIDI